jgi:hypothetical protein
MHINSLICHDHGVYGVQDPVNLIIAAARFLVAFAVEAELRQQHLFLMPWIPAGWRLQIRRPLPK